MRSARPGSASALVGSVSDFPNMPLFYGSRRTYSGPPYVRSLASAGHVRADLPVEPVNLAADALQRVAVVRLDRLRRAFS